MKLTSSSLLAISVLFSVLGAAWIVITPRITGQTTQGRIPAPQVGFLAPEIELTTFDGDNFTLSELRGKVVVLNFWASWCPPCRQEMPAFQAASEKYSNQYVAFIGVNNTAADTIQAALAMLDQFEIGFPNLIDPDNKIAQTYQVRALPTTFFINPDGVIEELYIGGPLPEALLDSTIQRLLQEIR